MSYEKIFENLESYSPIDVGQLQAEARDIIAQIVILDGERLVDDGLMEDRVPLMLERHDLGSERIAKVSFHRPPRCKQLDDGEIVVEDSGSDNGDIAEIEGEVIGGIIVGYEPNDELTASIMLVMQGIYTGRDGKGTTDTAYIPVERIVSMSIF